MTTLPHLITSESTFQPLSELIRGHARAQPEAPALCDALTLLSYAALNERMDRVAAALQREGVKAGQCVAICALSGVDYACVFLGALRAGVVVAPLAPSVTPQILTGMLRDAQASLLFLDEAARELVQPEMLALPRIALDGSAAGQSLEIWLAPAGSTPSAVSVAAEAAFNIIYSSGTTGTPKGIVQSHGMRWTHMRRGLTYGYSPRTRSLVSTPLYSNTTLVVFFPTLALGGCVRIMPKFNAAEYLALAELHHITHTMLVPVQYQRIMDCADFDCRDLSSFQVKFCTSAPFAAPLKADLIQRWPGALIEFYGMTEGGGTCILNAHEHPEKLHTVGQPAEGHDIRLIDEEGHELPAGSTGEVVGHSPAMMTGYYGQPEKTSEAEWYDPSGRRFIRTGDVGRFDAEGFLTLVDRRKDMIISGGFNLYPSDLEAVLREHPKIQEVAVVGMPSREWGETPVAYVVLRKGLRASQEELLQWYQQRVGKTQRLSALYFLSELPRSAIGKVLKRELRDLNHTTALSAASA
jgi:acyl-CoA synthetase (AMP-forming)/AMP-acid ligase II